MGASTGPEARGEDDEQGEEALDVECDCVSGGLVGGLEQFVRKDGGQRIAAVGGWEIWGARAGDQDGGAGRDAFVAAFTDGEGSGVGEDADVGKLWNGGSEGGSSDPEHGSGEAELSDEVGGMGDQDGQLAHT